MPFFRLSGSIALRLHRVATAVTALSALSATSASATQFVSTCDDSGPGSLRAAVAAAGDPDTVDMTQLVCGTISLTTGAIDITQNNLKISGSGASMLISGKNSPVPDRIFNHTGTGILQIYYLSIANGALTNASGDANGGCIYSKGSVATQGVNITSCTATSTATFGAARGGGIFTHGALTFKYGSLSNNTVNSGIVGYSYGGGAFVHGDFVANLATISGNTANSAVDRFLGGGLLLQGNVNIIGSTISGNHSSKGVGGIDSVHQSPGGYNMRIVNSTISGNSADTVVGGMYTDSGTAKIYGTTIAFNTAAGEHEGSLYEAPGLSVLAVFDNVTMTLESSLLANNTFGSAPAIEDDFTESKALGHSVTLTGHNNLVRVSSAGLPNGTLVSSCPLLGPLRDNGGPTQTHALLSTSIAIDNGNDSAINPTTMQPYPSDQRGSGFARVSGPYADIGAYEVQKDDIVFDAGFDGCP